MSNENELIQKSQNGDIDAFEELVCLYERRIYTIAYRMMGNHEDANDFAQEAFLRAFKSIKSFRGEASFLTWSSRIVTNVCRDELRKRRGRIEESLDEELILSETVVKKQVASSEPDPAELYEKKETKEKIHSLISMLSPEFRMVIVLRDIEGYSYEDIAEQLECSIGTVKSRLNRARNHLKKKLLSEREQSLKYERLYG